MVLIERQGHVASRLQHYVKRTVKAAIPSKVYDLNYRSSWHLVVAPGKKYWNQPLPTFDLLSLKKQKVVNIDESQITLH